MRILATILTYYFLLFGAGKAFAIDAPSLIGPANNSTITSSPSFSWGSVQDSSGYNILIDDEPSVTSPYAKNPYYPTNPSYTPQNLNPGTYYWKVKTKDQSGNWGSFSEIWSFTILASSPSPTPTPTPTPTPSPTPSPTPTPSSTNPPSSTPSPSSSSSTSSFIISNIPAQINSNQSFNLSVDLSLPDKSNQKYFLKGAFKKTEGSNYFGLTKVAGKWAKNSTKYSEQFSITTDSSGSWSGNLEVMPDSNDSGYTGSGDYIFKVARYDESGDGLTWSNEVAIKINNVEVSNPTITKTSISTPKPTNRSSASSNPSSITLKSSSPKPTQILKSTSLEASVAGVSTSATQSGSASAAIEQTKKKSPNIFIWIGSLFVIIGISLLGFIFYKKHHEKKYNLL